MRLWGKRKKKKRRKERRTAPRIWRGRETCEAQETTSSRALLDRLETSPPLETVPRSFPCALMRGEEPENDSGMKAGDGEEDEGRREGISPPLLFPSSSKWGPLYKAF